jgi:ATP/maltotriose-dependent transcriptional regulator MalT
MYEWAELQRLRGDLVEAEAKFAEAARWGHDPQPGLALLRLAQGRGDAAVAGLRRSLAEPHDSTVLPVVLAACVEVHVDRGETDAAASSLRWLRDLAAALGVPMAGALAAHAAAVLALARGDPLAALHDGRLAWTMWHDLEAPYHAARSRVVVGEACLALGDQDAARMELAAARSVFEDLGAGLDLRRLHELTGADEPQTLSRREREVLRLVAQGMTNRAIAGELFLSEKTVARHMSNIFVKVGVSTRTAAAAFAFTHDLA